MTTDRNRSRTRVALGGAPVSPLEWRLAAATGLAVIHLCAWSLVAARTKDSAAVGEPLRAPPNAEAGGNVTPVAPMWIDEIPLGERPTVILPPGYRLAREGRAESPGTPILASRTARVATRRPVRVRTRSS